MDKLRQDMLRTLGVFIIGVYVGQEYGKQIPSVKEKTTEYYAQFKTTQLYKTLEEQLRTPR